MLGSPARQHLSSARSKAVVTFAAVASQTRSVLTVGVAAGTRPEIIKLAPVVEALLDSGANVEVVATGQHWDHRMAGAFFDGLALRPSQVWNLVGDEGQRIGDMLTQAYRWLERSRLDAVLVQGDTYTTALVAFAARRHGVPVVHVEAGLRSFNPRSQEESNRKVTAALASVHFAPTGLAAAHLMAEGVPPVSVFVVGNTVCDALVRFGLGRLDVAERSGVLVTAHRAANVDHPARLALVVETIELLSEVAPVTMVLHPRTANKLDEFRLRERLEATGAEIIEPLEYAPMLERIRRSMVVVTDSGGLQEETSWFGVPVVVLRNSTPRWEGVRAGQAELAGIDPQAVIAAVGRLTEPDRLAEIAQAPCPYGDGEAGPRIATILHRLHREGELVLREPTTLMVPDHIAGVV